MRVGRKARGVPQKWRRSLLRLHAQDGLDDLRLEVVRRFEDIFGTAEKVAVGAEWPVNAAAAVKALSQNGVTGLKAEGVKGNATLVRIGEFERQPALVLKMAAQIDGREVQLASLPDNVKARRFQLEYAVEMEVPVDPTTTPGHIKSMVKMDIHAAGTEEFDARKVDIAVRIIRRVASDLTATPVK